MTESPEQMTRRILTELYPPPSPFYGPAFTHAVSRFGESVARFGASLSRLSVALRHAPTEPCRLCGGWGRHEDGCALGER